MKATIIFLFRFLALRDQLSDLLASLLAALLAAFMTYLLVELVAVGLRRLLAAFWPAFSPSCRLFSLSSVMDDHQLVPHPGRLKYAA